MFVKHGDGKIISVFKDEELTDEQKELIKKQSLDSKENDISDNKHSKEKN